MSPMTQPVPASLVRRRTPAFVDGASVAAAGLDADQDRFVTALRRLQCRGERFERSGLHRRRGSRPP